MAGLKFRVLLDSDRNEEVFRDILINDSDNFESFYTAIINAFRFQGEEMASFYVSNDDALTRLGTVFSRELVDKWISFVVLPYQKEVSRSLHFRLSLIKVNRRSFLT